MTPVQKIALLSPALGIEPKVLQFLALQAAVFISVFAAFLAKTGHPVDAGIAATIAIDTFLAGLTTSIVVYRLSHWHPLAKYPGPRLAKITKWYMSYWIAKGNQHLKLQEYMGLGCELDPMSSLLTIRLRCDPSTVKCFGLGSIRDADALITTNDAAEHASRLIVGFPRLAIISELIVLTIGMEQSLLIENLKIYRAQAKVRTAQLLDIVDAISKEKTALSLSHWISLWGIDVMGDMAFSGGFETMSAGKDAEGWMEVLHMGTLFVGVLGQVPWMRDILALAPSPGPILTFQQFAGKKVEETSHKNAGMRQDILGIIQDESSGGPKLSKFQAAADASFIVLAGSDTVSEAMAALMRYLTGHREIQEALRMIPPVAAGPPRWNGDEPARILDQYIPPGTSAACPVFTMHHDSRNFADPDSFRPERWLNGGIGAPHTTDAFVPFRYGPGVCIGKPVALYNMKLLTATIIRSFDLSFPDGFDVNKFDASYKEHNLWVHGDLMVKLNSLV
ncbi:cytochrome P450 [Armillaria gallica]|uniref:Cytochrome P450 n=1 Tax=Armillaria gallica TaxID=47427 RepID=A0A2H3DYL5_ARMGA|nr:cytochrome P450 [Armillaria gallica]